MVLRGYFAQGNEKAPRKTYELYLWWSKISPTKSEGKPACSSFRALQVCVRKALLLSAVLKLDLGSLVLDFS